MTKSLLEQLPRIVADGRQQAERILESLEGPHRVRLLTREWVLPARDTAASDWIADAVRRANLRDGQAQNWHNRLIHGDSLLAMAALLADAEHTPSLRGQVDLIYIDPAFGSKADYRTKVTLPHGPSRPSVASGALGLLPSGPSRPSVASGALGLLPSVELEQRPTAIEQLACSDIWSHGTASYLAMITPRLVLMRELLCDTGSIYVHLDPAVGYYVKIVMDEIFGRDGFERKVVWRVGCISGYKSRSAGNNRVRNHGKILYYTKSREFCFDKDYFPYPEDYVRGNGNKPEGTGRPIEDAWNRSPMDRLDSIQGTGLSGEKVGSDAQHNENLLARIIQASLKPGALVLDCFGGSGTTAAVAERLGCRWIASDLRKPACMIMRKRLIGQDAKPFLHQTLSDYQVDGTKTPLARSVRIGDLSGIVLPLYGALPLQPDDNPLGNLGAVVFGGKKTLVLVDSPNTLTSVATLRKAIAQREHLVGGWDRVVVLGWNFEPCIGQDLAALNDPRLEVLVIPPDLFERLRKEGGIEKLRGHVRFSSLQYLTVQPVQRRRNGDQEQLRITLDNYVPLSPEAINLDEDNRRKLQQVIDAEPLALIEYWAVDPDYDGVTFRSVWQDYRGNTANDDDPLRVTTQARFSVPHKSGERRVCVRVVDVFGFEADVVQMVPQARA